LTIAGSVDDRSSVSKTSGIAVVLRAVACSIACTRSFRHAAWNDWGRGGGRTCGERSCAERFVLGRGGASAAVGAEEWRWIGMSRRPLVETVVTSALVGASAAAGGLVAMVLTAESSRFGRPGARKGDSMVFPRPPTAQALLLLLVSAKRSSKVMALIRGAGVSRKECGLVRLTRSPR
jgi:hypothetical protein